MSPPQSAPHPGPPKVTSPDVDLRLRDQVIFVLVQPQSAGNVGAAARAMKNMGLRRLVVVDPAPGFDLERARWMAPHAADVLAEARYVATLDEALVGVHRVAGTTARHRNDGQPVLEPGPFAASVYDDDAVTAVLFGREDHGLSRSHTRRCESLVRIATHHHASLNLAQAVLLVGHHLFEEGRRRGLRADGRLVGGRTGMVSTRSLQRPPEDATRATVADLEPALGELVALLERAEYTHGTTPERVGTMLREVLQRARLTKRQVRAMRGMVTHVNRVLSQAGPDASGVPTPSSHDDPQ